MKGAKLDLATAIGAFVAGVFVAFLITNIFIPKVNDDKFSTIEQSINNNVAKPDAEVFNIEALNPTVVVCVGCDDEDAESDEEEDEYEYEEENYEDENYNEEEED